MSTSLDLSRLRAAAKAAFSGRDEVECAGTVSAHPLLPERLAGRLSQALDTHIEIEARDARSLPMALQGRIITEGALIHEGDAEARVRFETDVRRLYFDFLPLIERDAREGLLAGG